MSDLEQREFLLANGPAQGKLTGINHLQIIVRSMEESLVFYRDVLGLEVIQTRGFFPVPEGVPTQPVVRNYFLKLATGEAISLIELSDPAPPQQAMHAFTLWPGETTGPTAPSKLDHLAFNVETAAEVEWWQQHLQAHGVETSEIFVRRNPKFVTSVYFYDPSGNPLEIASWDWQNPMWREHKPEDWLLDPDPVPSLLR